MVFSTEIEQTAAYKAAQAAFASGAISTADRATLQSYITVIAQNTTGDDGVQARDTIQALTINHLIMQHHIDTLERRGKAYSFSWSP